ncbi:MAG: inositol monophosphatase family protein [Pseudonocardia sp.]
MDVESLWQELENVLLPTLRGFRSRLGSLRVEEKADKTLLSEADVAVQDQLIRCVRAVDPDGLILAEESAHLFGSLPDAEGRVWIIDPIDGTSQFVAPDGREFCSVVCLIRDRKPVAAFVLAPEIGPDRSPVSVRVTGPGEPIEINGKRAPDLSASERPRRVSVTRSSGTQPRDYEKILLSQGYQLKTRTTSQTLDMVRTCVDLAPFTDPALDSFGLFYREQQKVWDGVAGICLANASGGLFVGDGTGRERTTVDIALNVTEPQFDSTLIASDPDATRIIANRPAD